MSAEGQFLVGRVGLEEIRRRHTEARWVGGLTLGADPIAYAIAHSSWHDGEPLDAFTIRKSTKEHGTGRRIEGGLPTDAPTVVVEDTLTTGASTLEAIEVLEEHRARILGVLTLVNREEGGSEAVARAGYPLITLFTAAELIHASGKAVPE